MTIQDVYKIIDQIIADQKKARRGQDFLGLMLGGQALLEYIPKLIEYAVEQEAEYRKFEAQLVDMKGDNDKRFSGAYCETKAKATTYYSEWQKAKQFMELMYELVNISKKLAGSVDREMNAQ